MANKLSSFSNTELQELLSQSTSYTDFARKVGYKTKSGAIFNLVKREIEERGLVVSFKKKESFSYTPETIFVKDSRADQKTLRRWYEKGEYSEYKCAICGQLPIWNNKPLTLTLDHINGNNKDDRLENLRWICPNCDTQQSTYGAKNIR